MWKLKIVLNTGETITGPVVVPNNPTHSYDSLDVLKVIANQGASMVKRLPEVVAWEFTQ